MVTPPKSTEYAVVVRGNTYSGREEWMGVKKCQYGNKKEEVWPRQGQPQEEGPRSK